MNDNIDLRRNTRIPPMRARNGSTFVLAGFLFYEANELFLSLGTCRKAAWACGAPADASEWPFVIRTWMGPPYEHEGLEVCTGAELAARYAWARYRDEILRVDVWTLLDRRLCPVHVLWEAPGLAEDGSTTCEGTVRVGDTQIGRLSYVIAGAHT